MRHQGALHAAGRLLVPGRVGAHRALALEQTADGPAWSSPARAAAACGAAPPAPGPGRGPAAPPPAAGRRSADPQIPPLAAAATARAGTTARPPPQQRRRSAPVGARHRRGLLAPPSLLCASRPTLAPPQGLDHLVLALAPHTHLLLLSLKGRSAYEATTPASSRLFMRQCGVLTGGIAVCYRRNRRARCARAVDAENRSLRK